MNNVQSTRPAIQLNTSRSLLKYILLAIVTLGIYQIVFFYVISRDINIIASRYDGKKTMNYALLIFLIAPITLGIAAIVWYHRLSARIGEELNRRRIDYTFRAADFWLLYVLGALIIVGPFIYIHKLAKASNYLAEDFNING